MDSLPRAARVRVTSAELLVDLQDDRRIAVPLAWFPGLLGASKRDREDFRLLVTGEGIHWNALDEDLGVEGLLAGHRAAPAKRRTRT